MHRVMGPGDMHPYFGQSQKNRDQQLKGDHPSPSSQAEASPEKATKMIRGVEHLSYEQRHVRKKLLHCDRGEAMENVAQRNCGSPIHEAVQGHVGWTLSSVL